MCGRFVQSFEGEDLEAFYNAVNKAHIASNYNITPQSQIPVIIYSKKAQQKQIHLFRWGLIPSWSESETIGSKLINARAETIDTKPSFKNSFINKRCVIPASGFYEWQKISKQPYYINSKSDIFSFAGIWESWKNKNGELVLTCAIITTNASKTLSEIHERTPVTLSKEAVELWLNPDTPISKLKELLYPINDAEIRFHRVGRDVNSPTNNDANLINEIKI